MYNISIKNIIIINIYAGKIIIYDFYSIYKNYKFINLIIQKIK